MRPLLRQVGISAAPAVLMGAAGLMLVHVTAAAHAALDGDALLHGAGQQTMIYGRSGYSVPTAFDNWNLEATTALPDSRRAGNSAAPDYHGYANTIGLRATFPVLRARDGKTTLNLAADFRKFLNRAAGAAVSDKHIDVVSIGFKGDIIDNLPRPGLISYGVAAVGGWSEFGGAGEAASGTRTAGGYHKFSWHLLREQTVTSKLVLGGGITGQHAGKLLDSPERLYLGGPNGATSYPVDQASGDGGYMLNVNARYRLREAMQLLIFGDTGSLRQNYKAARAPSGAVQVRLSGAGIGIHWSDAGWSGKASLAWRFSGNSSRDTFTKADSNDNRRAPRLWMQTSKAF
jgi:hemolysin activation/secretion protein